MSGCKNCFNGCLETTSDQCVRYTGPAVPLLGIEEGEIYSLAAVETLITDYLNTVADGTGIVPSVNLNLCDIITSFLPTKGTITLNDILFSITQAICAIQDQVTGLDTTVTEIEGDYTVDCIDVETDAGTHAVLQAVITALCETSTDVADIIASLTQYVQISELNDYIASYLAGVTSTKMYNKMVPYVAVEYYGALSNYPSPGDSFDINGVGQGAWEKVYICNGYNGITPDKRGFSPVGATENSGGGALNAKVAALSYTSGTSYGEATVVLTEATLPAHTHTATGTAAPHSHTIIVNAADSEGADDEIAAGGTNLLGLVKDTSTSSPLDLTISVASKGGSESHNNIPPVLACHYIMYIP